MIRSHISNPLSPQYGEYMSKASLSALISPNYQKHVEAVAEFLLEAPCGLNLFEQQHELLGHNDILSVTMSLAQIQRCFGSKFFQYKHPLAPNRLHIAASEPISLPSALSQHVDVISGVRYLPPLDKIARRRFAASHAQRPVASMSGALPAPVITNIDTSNIALFPTVQVTCPNGTLANVVENGERPFVCDSDDTLLGFDVRISVMNGAHTGRTIDYALANSRQQLNGCSSSQKTCILSDVIVDLPFHLFQVQVRTAFKIQGVSEWNSFYNVSMLTSDFVSPQLLHDVYNIPRDQSAAHTSQSIASFLGEYYSPSDLELFWNDFGVRPAPVHLVGPNNPSNPGDEGQLDITWITAMGQQANTTFWSVGNNGYLLEWATEVLSSNDPPKVSSISYADNESDLTQEYGAGWVQRVENEFSKFAARGLTIVVASGDAGSTNVGHGFMSCSGPFQPQWPATSEWCLSVGATALTNAYQPFCFRGSYGGLQVTCSSPQIGEILVSTDDGQVWTSGAGMSNMTARPSWQQKTVDAYLSTHQNDLPPSWKFNISGRAVPDVVGCGSNLIVPIKGQTTVAAGTSASTPIWAGMLSLINSVLAEKNLPSLGHVNPMLYHIQQIAPEAFQSVSWGTTNGGDVLHPPHIKACPYGFTASHNGGYSIATGLGSPNWSKLMSEIVEIVQGQKK
eukprot:CAMPEP_0201546080 /NCGR_PEP_ID=MMETSP0173_2-20130828/2468_1 /ASSEMBLY_ACC=CAM_ASM_000268 /TAXON_ID=218659 /ORGANISM="Vexillifera sp., Strain DIVA3 564/2" /LENGTH=679 /DNA_ID=CAMNT_0047954667 /DNA_START=176 /DNA_END=2215 /DNA_ORIENTATION=-